MWAAEWSLETHALQEADGLSRPEGSNRPDGIASRGALPGSKSGARMHGFPRNLGDPAISFRTTAGWADRLNNGHDRHASARGERVAKNGRAPGGTAAPKETRQSGKGRRKSEHPDGTEEAGELVPRDPAEGSGVPGRGARWRER